MFFNYSEYKKIYVTKTETDTEYKTKTEYKTATVTKVDNPDAYFEEATS